MEVNSFWLIAVEESTVIVSLISSENNVFSPVSIGSAFNWDSQFSDSFIGAVDQSLSSSANLINLPEDQEPENTAFILPPFWVGSDGKITSSKLKLIESVCKNLNLKPMGFIASDEAITEEANIKDSFPASFVLVDVDKNEFTLSLVYLGKVKERIQQKFESEITGSLIESTLLNLKSDATLPPQIIFFGQIDETTISNLKNYPWVGKKNIEIFLHFPDIKFYSSKEIINIFSKIISLQLKPSLSPTPVPKPVSQIEETITEEVLPEDEPSQPVLEEVSASELGFGESDKPLPPPPPKKAVFAIPKIKIPPIKFNFKFLKFRFNPKIKIKKFNFLPIAFAPLLILIPFFFSTAKISLFITPYNFSKKVPILLDANASSLDISKGIIPVSKKSIDVNVSSSIKTTGQKLVGEKAKGEIVVFNKQDKVQNIAKGSILIDSNGQKFELINSVSVASSSSDLEKGVINLGQTKTIISASDIGPEFNINKDSKLTFKDYPETILLAKAEENFVGGSKRQIEVASQEDKNNLEKKINEDIKNSTEEKIKNDLTSLSGAIKETIQDQKNRIEYNREVGEETTELSASVDASVMVFVIDENEKTKIINGFLSNETGFNQSKIDPNLFQLSFNIDNLNSDQAKGSLTIQGKALPKIDIGQLQKKLSGKSKNKASSIIKKEVPRLYNFKITNNFQFLGSLNPLPFRPQNINIDTKIDSL